jgi:hypothetical protein
MRLSSWAFFWLGGHMLTQEVLLENFRYDETTGNLYWKVKRSYITDLSKPISAKDSSGYIRVCTKLSGKIKNYGVHRLIWTMVYGVIPKNIDHIDGDRTNNKISNLREATHQQNMMNRKKRCDSKNTYKGTYRVKNSWIAEIWFMNKRYYLGSFKTDKEAGLAYAEAAKKFHGNFART